MGLFVGQRMYAQLSSVRMLIVSLMVMPIMTHDDDDDDDDGDDGDDADVADEDIFVGLVWLRIVGKSN